MVVTPWLALALTWIAGSLEEPSLEALRWQAPPSIAGAEACVDCHEHIVESWSRTGMARALSHFDPKEFQGMQPVADTPSGFVYHFESDAAGARVVETRPNAPEHRLEAPIAYAVGAGELDRAYVVLQGAFEFFAPLEIVTGDEERYAALAPGHMAEPHQRFSVSITPECLGCHTDRLPPPAFPLNLHQQDWEPRGISCAACHGPVERHAAWRSAHLAGARPQGSDPIVRAQDLGREQRMSICAACHLQGDVRIPLDSRMGPPEPGGDLLHQRAVFVAARPTADVGFVSQTERLVLSRCFQQSAALSCASCHDPHRSLYDGDERRHVRDACLDCHASGAEATAQACSRPESVAALERDCASCHMRKTPVFDLADVEIHDHFIRRRPGPPSRPARPRAMESPTGDWKLFGWPSQPPPEYSDDPGLWMLAYFHLGDAERALAKALEAPGPRSRSFPMYHHVRAGLFERAGAVDRALASYARALELDSDLVVAAINLGLLRGLRGERERGIALLEEVLARHPEAVNALRNRAGLRFEIGDSTGFVADLTRAFELLPDAVVADILADWYRASGDPAAAARWSARATQLDPIASD